LLTAQDAEKVEESGVEEVRIFSPVTCKALKGICQKCYGNDLGANALVNIGEAVGVVAAQAIGEPGTQLTMRTFHHGGVAAGGDMTMGLPRVEQIFELITPNNPTVLCEGDGQILEIKEEEGEKRVIILEDYEKEAPKAKSKKEKTKEYKIPFGRYLIVKEGDKIKKGKPLTDGALDIKQLFSLAGKEPAQDYILNEVGKVYSLQGAAIDDKHIEVIVRQMFSRLRVKEAGSAALNIGEVISRAEFDENNDDAKEEGGEPAKAIPMIMGIKEVAITSPSFLSAASFQNTVKVLVKNAIKGREDKLVGLKENVILGRLIPAGTGLKKDYIQKDEEEENFEDSESGE